MTADELEELATHPLITIGAHTRHHRMLTRLGDDEVRAELVEGTSDLDELLGPADRVLAYPHGAAARRTATTARATGFPHAFTTSDRPVSLLDPDRLLPRRHPKDVDEQAFAEWLASG
jgi:peptidoglycan/xylan/chitin deacetylase (PgdA/CDA1 family)